MGFEVESSPINDTFSNRSSNYQLEFKLYEVYANRIKHEDELLHYRTTWLVQVQGFLLAAFAAGFWASARSVVSLALIASSVTQLIPDNSQDIKKGLVGLCSIGVLFSIVSLLSIFGAVRSIMGIEKRWSNIVEECHDIISERNTKSNENRLDIRILRDLPRLTNGLKKHRVKTLSSAVGIFAALSPPGCCLLLWLGLAYQIGIGFRIGLSFTEHGLTLQFGQ